MRALLTGEWAVGALEWVLGEAQHKDLLLHLQPYLGVRDALLVPPQGSPQAWFRLGPLGCNWSRILPRS